MYLVTDPERNPVSLFDNINDAIACICEWSQRSARYTVLERVWDAGFRLLDSDSGMLLGFVQEGILYNPPVTHY
jgi:hypothetical protein